MKRFFGVTGFLSLSPMTWKLMIVVAAGVLGCQAREVVQRESREEALQELDETEMPDPCDLTGRWDVDETVTGGTCEGERLMVRPLGIAIEDRGISLAISREMGQKYLASGRRISMRLWEEELGQEKPETRRDYETVGFVIKGGAELHLEGQTVKLTAGDSWVVPEGASHTYRILERFEAVEATSPPAHVHGRDES